MPLLFAALLCHRRLLSALKGWQPMHARFMQEALSEAQLALQTADVPVGAVVVVEGKIIGRGRNQREALADPTAHAEVLALRQAAQRLGSWRLTAATLYVTLEPCIMCVGAAVLSRIQCLVFGCRDPKAGACGSQFDILGAQRLNHTFPVLAGVCEAEASALLSGFFQRLRQHTQSAGV
jgi:tRNA(adenine34) deaminase